MTQGITNQGMTQPKTQGMTEAWYPNKRTDERGKPIQPVTLSDGQLWYPCNR